MLIQPQIEQIRDQGSGNRYRMVSVETIRGPVRMRFYEGVNAKAGMILVGGVGGDFDTPALGLYPRLCEALMEEHLAGLRIAFRHPTELEESVHDLLAGIRLLVQKGISRIGLIGHSFGGAVVITAGAVAPEAATVVALSTQSYGTDRVDALAPRPVLFIHGSEDEVLPPFCSIDTYRRAGEPKELKIIKGAGHVLDEAGEEVNSLVIDWLRRHLRK